MKLSQMKKEQLRKVVKEARKELKKRKRLNESMDDVEFGRKMSKVKREALRLMDNTVEDIHIESTNRGLVDPISSEEVQKMMQHLAKRVASVYETIILNPNI